MFENTKKWIHIVNAGFSGWKEAAGDTIATPGFVGEASFASAADLRIATPGYVGMVAGAEAPERVWVSTPGYTGYLAKEDAHVAIEGVLCGVGA